MFFFFEFLNPKKLPKIVKNLFFMNQPILVISNFSDFSLDWRQICSKHNYSDL